MNEIVFQEPGDVDRGDTCHGGGLCVDAEPFRRDGRFEEPDHGARTHHHATCVFAGAPMTCSAAVFELPGYNKQGLVFGYSELEGRKIRFVCDIVTLPDPVAMSAPCSLFFDAKIGAPKI